MTSFVSEPLDVIDEILSQNVSNSVTSHASISQAFEDWSSNPDNLSQVPIINIENLVNNPRFLQTNKLVRFRGMVQDTSFGQEVYITRYFSGSRMKFNSYRDFAPETFVLSESSQQSINESPPAIMEDRELWYAVSTPSLSSWAHSGGLPDIAYSNSNEMIRTLNPKYPIPDQPHLGLILKLYGASAGRLRANVTETVDLIGILGTTNSQDIVVHVVALRKIIALGLDLNYPWVFEHPVNILNVQTRSQLLSCLTQVLGGDNVAGEILLLHLFGRLSSTERIVESANRLTVLNLILPDRFDKRPLCEALEKVLPIFHVYRLTIAGLNNDTLLPSFRDSGGLHSGLLQLPPTTFLVIDETNMGEGRLTELGTKNLQGLTELASNARLSYHYPFFQTNLLAPMSILILSSSVKSMTPAQFHVSVAPNNRPSLSQSNWASFRPFMHPTLNARTYTIPEELAEQIQVDFVEKRQVALAQAERLALPGTVPTLSYSQHDLERQLLLARLTALSLEPNLPHVILSSSVWSHAQNLCFAASDSLNSSSNNVFSRYLSTSLNRSRADSPPPCR